MSLTVSSSPRDPVWWRLAREMRAEGYSVAAIAEEFGEDVETVEIVACDIEPSHAERMRKLNADPEFKAAHAERMRKLHADPEFKALVGRRPRWCPSDMLDEYRALSARYDRDRAKQIIRDLLRWRGQS